MSRSEGVVCDASLVPLWGWLWHSLTQSAVVAVRAVIMIAVPLKWGIQFSLTSLRNEY
jgi:hypothetical protein